MKIFTLYDVKSCSFGTPFFSITTGVAIRTFTQLINDPDSLINMWPQDFQLFELGEFDSHTGAITTTLPPLFITSAETILETQRGNEMMDSI